MEETRKPLPLLMPLRIAIIQHSAFRIQHWRGKLRLKPLRRATIQHSAFSI